MGQAYFIRPVPSSELIGTKLELVIRRFAAVKSAKRYCKSNRYNFSEN